MTFEQTIAHYISRHHLMRHDGFYLVALSGGADSVALLYALRSLGYRVSAVHCNFHLRGAESDRDENFCVSLCAEIRVTLHRVHFDTAAYAELHKVSIEMAARELRYHYFEQLRRDIGADGICVAHHRDDQVETVLLNLVRGTGLAGLQGMRPANGHVLRPMLGVSREDVLQYLAALGQAYVTDSSNLETDVMRNKLRLNVVPLLEEVNPAVKENIARMTENLAEVSKMTDAALQESVKVISKEDGSYSMEALKRMPSPSCVLWTLLEPHGFNRSQVMEMLAGERSGAQWMSAEAVVVTERGHLYIYGRKEWEAEMPVLRIPEPGVYVYAMPSGGVDGACAERHELKFRLSFRAVNDEFEINRSAACANLDADKVVWPLTVRPVAEGDRFMPLGMAGTKLVSDFLTDLKVSSRLRRRQLVMEDANGHIVWVVGRRIDDRFAIRPGATERALMVSV